MGRRAARATAGIAVGLATAVWTVGVGSAGHPPVDEPECELDGHVLRIDPGHFDMRIVRAGDTISPRTSRGETNCGPVAPTVDVVDRVRVDGSEFTLDLGGGPFAPGFTDEGDESSEIEFRILAGLGGLRIKLPGEAQNVRAGALGGREFGVNLNADEATPDVDLEIRGPRRPFPPLFDLTLHSGDGRDRIVTSGGPGFAGPLRNFTTVTSGRGADLVRTGKGTDFVKPGAGRDEVNMGRGGDLLDLKDGLRDIADCGSGADLMVADHRDRTHSCRRLKPGP